MKNLKLLRQKRNISQQKLADLLQLSQQSIYKYENGLAEPDFEILKNMADFFDTSIDYLIGYTNYDQKIQPYKETFLSSEESEHIQAYRSLSPHMRTIINELISEYLNKNM